MISTSPLPGLAPPAGEPPLVVRGGVLGVATKLARVPPPAHLRPA
ncbi:MAG TPA: hypothetical protein VF886_01800 [Roseiarcus sp.]